MAAKLVRGAIVVAILGLVVTLAFAFRRDPHDIRTGTVGKPAPELIECRLHPRAVALVEDVEHLGDVHGHLRSLRGQSLRVAECARRDLKGKVVVLNFFASWCLPCTEENPALVHVYERYRASDDVVMIGVNYQETRDNGLAYVRRMGMSWVTLADDDGRAALAYGVFGPPETFFIGPDGVIAGRHIGWIDEATLIAGIEAIRPAAAR